MRSQNLSGLRRLYDTVETNIRGLKSLGVERESYMTLLSPVILKKLPQDLRLIISRQRSRPENELGYPTTVNPEEIERDLGELTYTQVSTFELNQTALPFSPGTSLESSQAVGSNPTSTLHVENENAVLLQTAMCSGFQSY
uniref:Uncharacterized protein n=1 Tax=Amphimedon queenslandica TaxID=400682 RepID=A0A1X7VKJ5_AMPQE